MTLSVCISCGRYWTHNAGTSNYAIITRCCPDCIARLLPVMGNLLLLMTRKETS